MGVLHDLPFSCRELRKNSGLALTAILSLTLGIGATTAVFSVIYGLLVNPAVEDHRRFEPHYSPFIKLKPGISRAAANSQLQALLERFAKETPSHFPKNFRLDVRRINQYYVQHLGHSLFLLFGAVGLLLLIGCGNVSILLLARGAARQPELAIRAAMGASRGRIQRQLLTEALSLSLAGAFGGVILAYNLLPVFLKWLPRNPSRAPRSFRSISRLYRPQRHRRA